MSSYAHYKGQCPGRLLNFLQDYCRGYYDRVTFEGGGVISYRGEVFATYTWDEPVDDGGRSDIPTFVFVNPLFNQAQDHYKAQLIEQEFKRDRWLAEQVARHG